MIIPKKLTKSEIFASLQKMYTQMEELTKHIAPVYQPQTQPQFQNNEKVSWTAHSRQ